MVLTSISLLKQNPNPTEDEIRWGISGNLCRCTGYNNLVKSVQYAALKLAGKQPEVAIIDEESTVREMVQ